MSTFIHYFTSFWLVLDCNLVNIPDHMLSKCTYLIFTYQNSCNCLSAPIIKVLPVAVLHGLHCFFGVTFGFVSAFFMLLYNVCSGSPFHIHCTFFHMLDIVSVGVSFHNTYSTLLLSFPFHPSLLSFLVWSLSIPSY